MVVGWAVVSQLNKKITIKIAYNHVGFISITSCMLLTS